MEHRGCSEYDVQIVELSGVSVERQLHDGGIGALGTELTVSGLPASSPNAALLVQARIETAQSPPDCNLTLRGSMPSSTSVAVTRADGGCDAIAVDQIVWERIDFDQRATVQAFTVTLAGGNPTMDVAISPVDVTRTLVLSSSQVYGGQAGGETVINGEADEASFRLDLTSPTNVRLTRGDDDVAATITFYVVELEP
jgi:hypothetical protein